MKLASLTNSLKRGSSTSDSYCAGEGKVVVEVKAVERFADIHRAQLLSYLKLGGFRLGYLLNFNVPKLKDGLSRLVNGL